METSPIDNLKIVVTADGGKTVSTLKKLASALKDLKSAQNGSFKGLSKLADYLADIGAAVELIDVKKLQKVCDSLAKLNGCKFNIKLKNDDVKKANSLKNALAPISNTKGWTHGKSEGGGQATNNAKGAVALLNGKTPELINTNQLYAMSRAEERFKELTKRANELFQSFKRIAMYRIIRTVLKQIGEAFTTGLNNAYAFSSYFGTQFATSLDNITTSLLYMKNALGSALSEALIALEPIIISLADAMADFANKLAQAFAYMNGSGTYLKAIKYFQRYNEEVTQTNKSLMKFDEINKLNGNTSDVQKALEMFKETDVNKQEAANTSTLLTTAVTLFAAIKGLQVISGALGGLTSLFGSGTGGQSGNNVMSAGLVGIGGLVLGSEKSDYAWISPLMTALAGLQIAGPWGALIGGIAGTLTLCKTYAEEITDGFFKFAEKITGDSYGLPTPSYSESRTVMNELSGDYIKRTDIDNALGIDSNNDPNSPWYRGNINIDLVIEDYANYRKSIELQEIANRRTGKVAFPMEGFN